MITWAFADIAGLKSQDSDGIHLEGYAHALIWLGSITRVSNRVGRWGHPICWVSSGLQNVRVVRQLAFFPLFSNFDRFPGKSVSMENCMEIKFSFCDPGGFGMDVASAP